MLPEVDYELITQIVLEVYNELYNKKSTLIISQKEVEEIDYLSIGTMGRLANGTPMNKEEEILFKKLIKGQNLVVLEENIEFFNMLKKPNYKLSKLLNQQLQTLKDYGLIIKKKEKNISEYYSKKLYTLEKIKALQLMEGSTFYKNEKDIITPLAIDYLNRQCIKIEMR